MPGANGVQFQADLIATWIALTFPQRAVFIKFFGKCVGRLEELGPVLFWARVQAISIITPQLTQQAAIQEMNL